MVWTLKPHGSWGEATTSAPATEMAAVLALPGSWPWFPAQNTVLVRKDQWLSLPSVPEVESINPPNGDVAGGDQITITGNGFTGSTGVTFGGAAATGFLVNSATQITCISPPGAEGAANVVIQNPRGNTTVPNGFTYGVPV